MQGQRDRIERAGDEIGACADGFECGRERVARGALAVEADREAARLTERADQLVGAVRLQRARAVVAADPYASQLRHLLRLLDQVVRLAGVARAIHAAVVQLALRSADRLAIL